MKKSLEGYRSILIDAEQKAQEDFDKTVLTLSGGGLGITFAFIKDIAGPQPVNDPVLILSAWICWGASLLSVLLSYFSSHLALRKAIEQVDAGKIYKSHPGGLFDWATGFLNAAGAILFIAGVVLAAIFAFSNLGA